MRKNKVTFDYSYSIYVTGARKAEIDAMIAKELSHTFWGLYHDGLITDFHLIDEDLNPLGKEVYDEDNV